MKISLSLMIKERKSTPRVRSLNAVKLNILRTS